MFETFGFEEFTARQASVVFALLLGIIFGALAERTGFCFRSAVVGVNRRSAAGVWAAALAVSVAATQVAVLAGVLDFSEHRLLASDLPILAVALGGALFGVGMVLTRGCVSRLAVLSGTGNLRALIVLSIFALVAHATLKGVLAPLRVALGGFTLDAGGALPGGALLWTGVIVAGAALIVRRSGARPALLIGGAAIGLLAALGWIGTGYILYDDFDPIAFESLSFTSPAAETLFFVIASSAIPAGFGPGLFGGVLLGALAAALLCGGFRWQSFDSPSQTGRYLTGGALMGFGGVLAGGCTLGAGLSGIATLGIAAVLALVCIALGALAANAALGQGGRAPAASRQQPAE